MKKDLIFDNGLLVITGATGWVGRTAIYQLLNIIQPEEIDKYVRAFASKSGFISLKYKERVLNIPVYPLETLPTLARNSKIFAILHAAFLTRDRLNEYGKNRYISLNRWITRQVEDALKLSTQARLVIISSGASAAFDDLTSITEELQNDPYGFLKNEEELLLSGLAPSLVLRIYALSGCFIRKPERFALGDFLLSALKNEAIKIDSPVPVVRSYGNASDITSLAWSWLLSMHEPLNNKKPIASVNLQTDLVNLAYQITSLYNLPPVESSIDSDSFSNIYIADSSSYINSLQIYGIQAKTLDLQILDTAHGLLNEFMS